MALVATEQGRDLVSLGHLVCVWAALVATLFSDLGKELFEHLLRLQLIRVSHHYSHLVPQRLQVRPCLLLFNLPLLGSAHLARDRERSRTQGVEALSKGMASLYASFDGLFILLDYSWNTLHSILLCKFLSLTLIRQSRTRRHLLLQ